VKAINKVSEIKKIDKDQIVKEPLIMQIIFLQEIKCRKSSSDAEKLDK